MKKYVCSICGFVYDEAIGIPNSGILPGTKWEDLPDDWTCPLCGAVKGAFKEQKETVTDSPIKAQDIDLGEMRELSVGELSALCSNLAKGCEKQYLSKEFELFSKLSDYFKSKTAVASENQFSELTNLIENDLKSNYEIANTVAENNSDRGAKRALLWSEKVTKILESLLTRYEKDGNSMIENTNVYVCEICGFIYIGDEPPEICPICKVPKIKITQIQRRG